jgi:hypothetical protein
MSWLTAVDETPMNRFDAGADTKQRWKNRRGGLVAAMAALCVFNILRAGGDGIPLLALVALALGGGLGAVLVVRVVDRRRRSALPPGIVHTVGASLLIDELRADEGFRPALAGVRRWLIRWLAMGRVAGRLEISRDRLTWQPGVVARWSRMPALDVPLRGVEAVEVVSAAFPIDYAGVELHLPGGSRLSVETRGAGRLRHAFAQTVLADEDRTIDPASGPSWSHDSIPAARKARITRPAAFGLLAAWAVLFVLLFGPFDTGEDTGNALVDTAAFIFIVLAVFAIGFLVVRSPWGPRLSAAAAVAGLVASLGDLALDGILGATETVVFGAFLVLAVRLGALPHAEPQSERKQEPTRH